MIQNLGIIYLENYYDEYNSSLSNLDDDVEYSLEDLDDLAITKKYPYEAKREDTTALTESVPKPESIGDLIEEDFYKAQYSFDGDSKIGINKQYSEITGVNLGHALHNILEIELKRSAATEQDLAIVLIKLNELSLESLVAKRIAQVLIEFIKTREMIFEYEDSGFAVIMYNMNIDQVMIQTELIYKRIQEILDEYSIPEPIAFGITTRATRLMDADRMIEEARAALARAVRNPEDPIVAFKVNPEKYRRFISEA